MSLPGSQRRALNQIERTLAADDYSGLGPLFAIFASLTGGESMPVIERVTARPWPWPWRRRRMRPGVITVVSLAMVAGALLTLSLMLPRPQVCAQGRVALVAVQERSVPAGRQPACVTQQNKPSETNQSGVHAP